MSKKWVIIMDRRQDETWGVGVETQKNKKNLVPLFKKDKNKKSHQPWTYAPVTALLVQGSRITYCQVPFDGPVITVIHWLARQLHQDMYTFVCFVCLFV